MIIHDVQQGSFEWLNLRAGRFTATDAQALAEGKKGLETAALCKAAFWLTGNLPDIVETKAMQEGHIREPKARRAYEEYMGRKVQTVGFAELDEYVGCSPDGLVGEDGLIEIKCKQDKAHLYTVLRGKIEAEHWAQMQFQMLICGRKWADYVGFNPMFKNPLYVQRVWPDAQYQAALADGLDKGRELVKSYIQKYKEAYL